MSGATGRKRPDPDEIVLHTKTRRLKSAGNQGENVLDINVPKGAIDNLSLEQGDLMELTITPYKIIIEPVDGVEHERL